MDPNAQNPTGAPMDSNVPAVDLNAAPVQAPVTPDPTMPTPPPAPMPEEPIAPQVPETPAPGMEQPQTEVPSGDQGGQMPPTTPSGI